MAPHKVRAHAQAEDGSDVRLFFETLASEILCITENENEGGDAPPTKTIKLDELLNDYADEINSNTTAIAQQAAILETLDPSSGGETPFTITYADGSKIKFGFKPVAVSGATALAFIYDEITEGSV